MESTCCSEVQPTRPGAAPKLENLIPIAVATAAGCEPCAEKAVSRALAGGSTARDVERTISVISVMSQRDCFIQRVGVEVASRLEKPLAAARRTLELAMASDESGS